MVCVEAYDDGGTAQCGSLVTTRALETATSELETHICVLLALPLERHSASVLSSVK